MQISNKHVRFFLIGIIISFATTILTGYIFYGFKIFMNTMAPTQIMMNATGGALFFYILKYFNLKIAVPVLAVVMFSFWLFYSYDGTLYCLVKMTLFFFALGMALYIYHKFVFNQFYWILRPFVLAIIFGLADVFLFLGLQTIVRVVIKSSAFDSIIYIYEFIYGVISGFGLGVGIEISDYLTTKLSGEKKETPEAVK